MDNKLLSISATFAALGGFAVYVIYQRQKLNRKNNYYDVLFFPEDTNSSKNVRKIVYEISKAKKSLDLCLYCLTSPQLCDAIIQTSRKNPNLIIRLITESTMSDVSGSLISSIRRHSGAFVRMNKDTTSSFLMHHKFAIIDDRTLITGSLNWTGQALTVNYENVLITNDKHFITKFKREFQRIWDLFT